jgi:hypothetical protein
MRLSAGLLCIVTQAWTVNANVEKTIFLGPNPVTLSNVRPGLDHLGLHYLSPDLTILPIRVPVQFPTESVPRGLESWYLLRRLEDGRRYEVRICWPATVSLMLFPVGVCPDLPSNPPTSGSILIQSLTYSIRLTWHLHYHSILQDFDATNSTTNETSKRRLQPRNPHYSCASRLQRPTTRPIAH